MVLVARILEQTQLALRSFLIQKCDPNDPSIKMSGFCQIKIFIKIFFAVSQT
jgi:hypothetical protein